jgi:hypothetical protein
MGPPADSFFEKRLFLNISESVYVNTTSIVVPKYTKKLHPET